MTQNEFMKYAFAENGDREDIPLELENGGSLNIKNGYEVVYSEPVGDGQPGRYIKREGFNGILNLYSAQIIELQRNGGRLWDRKIAENGGYSIGAKCLFYYDIFKNRLVTEPEPYKTKTITLISLTDSNSLNPAEDDNVNKSWYIEDGIPLFGIVDLAVNQGAEYFRTPAGYMELGGVNPEATYNFTDYPRVKEGFDVSASVIDGVEYLGVFQKVSAESFKILDLRGYFRRIYSNGSNIDNNRVFSALQGDAIRNIYGSQGIGAGCFASTGVFGTQPSGFNRDSVGNENWNVFNFDASRVVPVANENRPYNYNVKSYIKI